MSNPWAAIEKPSADLNVRLVDQNHPLRLFWGLDSHERYCFAFEAAGSAMPKKNSVPALSGIDICIIQQKEKGKLLLVLQNKNDWEIFFSLCGDLISSTISTKNEADGASSIVRRLLRWQRILRQNRPDILTLEEIKGLMGELLFLQNPLATVFGFDEAITSWRGPELAPQDFAIGETAIEIKCQAGGSRSNVRISSLDQLNPQLPIGYLVVYTLARQTEDDPKSLTLNALVRHIRKQLEVASAASRERFEDLIFQAGYVFKEDYENFRFSVVQIKSYKISDGFPRILPSCISPGIESVSYSIRLEACEEFLNKPKWWED